MENSSARLRSELQDCQRQCQEIDIMLSKKERVHNGTFDFSYYRLKKQKNDIQDKIIKLSRMLTPDIIA